MRLEKLYNIHYFHFFGFLTYAIVYLWRLGFNTGNSRTGNASGNWHFPGFGILELCGIGNPENRETIWMSEHSILPIKTLFYIIYNALRIEATQILSKSKVKFIVSKPNTIWFTSKQCYQWLFHSLLYTNTICCIFMCFYMLFNMLFLR